MGQDVGKMVVVSGGAVSAQGATLICSRLAHRSDWFMLLGKAAGPLPKPEGAVSGRHTFQ